MRLNSLVRRDRQQNIINEKVIRAMKKIKMVNNTKDVGYAVVGERMRKKDGLESSVGWMGCLIEKVRSGQRFEGMNEWAKQTSGRAVQGREKQVE